MFNSPGVSLIWSGCLSVCWSCARLPSVTSAVICDGSASFSLYRYPRDEYQLGMRAHSAVTPQQTQGVLLMSVLCWDGVADAGPTLNRHKEHAL